MTKGLELRRLAKDSTYNLIRQIWTIVIGMAISILLARGLGIEQRGIYTLAVLLPELLVTFLNLGVAPATVYFISRKKTDPQQTIGYNTNLAIWISLGTIIIGVAGILFASDLFFPNVPSSLLLLSLLIVPFSLFITYLNSIFQGLEDFRAFNIISMASQLAMLILVIFFVWIIPMSSTGAMISYLGGDLLGLMLLFIFLFKKVGSPTRWDLRLNISYTRQIMDYSIKSHVSNAITYLNYRVDNFLLNRIAGPSPVGLYSISVGLSERLWIPSTAIGSVIFPRIASLEDGDIRREEITPLTTRFVLWFSIILAIIATPILVWLIPILYSTEYIGSIQPLLLLIPGTIAFNAGRILSNDIAGRGKPEINMLISAIALVINIIANLYLIPYFNASGAAIASTISYTVLGILVLIAYCRLSSVRWTKILIPQKSDSQYLKKFLKLSLQNLKRVIMP
jgi:O-antigen/teichoic acid export membrane protein